MSCLTLADLLAAQYANPISGAVEVSYYPQVLTGYATATQLRDPSEEAAVSVTGLWFDEAETAQDGVLVRTASFSFAATSELTFSPHALDALAYNGFRYRVKGWGSDGGSYTLTLESEGVVE